jgi:hypothetical protein
VFIWFSQGILHLIVMPWQLFMKTRHTLNQTKIQ